MIRGLLQAMRAEYRKLLTVRSTYFVFGLMFLFELLFSFFIFGFHQTQPDLTNSGSNYLENIMINGVYFLAVFPAFVTTLLITHEYRHGTILYALTSSPSRLRIIYAKIKVASVYAIITTLLVALTTAGLALLGVRFAGHHITGQSLPYGSFLWELLFYGWGVAMFGLMIGALVRNQVVAIVSLLVIPNIVEQIVSLLLKANSVYLPFTALAQVIGNPSGNPSLDRGHLSPVHAAGVFLLYLIVGWIVAIILFERRSAN